MIKTLKMIQAVTIELPLAYKILRDHGQMTPSDIWAALRVSRQGAMDLLKPLIEAGLIEKRGGKKTGRYALRVHDPRSKK